MLLILAGIVAGIPAGGVLLWIIQTRVRVRGATSMNPQDLALARWERTGNDGMSPALREMRRLYPTHDVVPTMRFLDLVRVKGTTGEAVRTLCNAWTVAAVIVDRRTAEIVRVILWSDDDRLSEKTSILHKVGFHVRTIPSDAGMEELAVAMAA